MEVNPGELDKRIQIVKISRKKNENAFEQEKEEIVRRCWAKVRSESGQSLLKRGIDNTDLTKVQKRVLIRFCTLIKKEMYVKYEGDLYEIMYMNNVNEEDRYLEMIVQRHC